MAPVPIQYSAAAIDLSPRLFKSAAVAASPTDSTETIIATLTCTGDIALIQSAYIFGWAAFTIGTNGVNANLRIRKTDASGTVVAATGAVNEGVAAATQLGYRSAFGFDAAATLPGQVYVLTLTVGSASAGSTVSAVALAALVA